MTHATLQLEAVSPIRLYVPTKVVVFITTTLLVCISVVLFMMDSTSDQVGAMLTTQNAASLKLWSNLKYYERHHTPGDASLPPGLMGDVVEYSRTTANIRDRQPPNRPIERGKLALQRRRHLVQDRPDRSQRMITPHPRLP